jgi:hypothetical protein
VYAYRGHCEVEQWERHEPLVVEVVGTWLGFGKAESPVRRMVRAREMRQWMAW